MVTQLESVMSLLGERGRYQIFMHLLLSYCYVILVFNHVIMSFHGMKIPHTCIVEGEEALYDNLTYTVENPVVNATHGSCSSMVFYEDGNNQTVECTSPGQWTYNPKGKENSIVSEFDLVCDNKHLPSLATTIYFIGVMVGGLLFGDLADRFGRLPVLLLTVYLSLAVGLATAFSINYVMFVVLRFVNGFLVQGMQTAAYTMIMELFVARHRPFAGAITESFFGISVMLLAGLAYLFRDWRNLQIAVTVPGILTVIYLCLAQESLRWLLSKGHFEKAEKMVRKICQINKVKFPGTEWDRLVQSTKESQRLGDGCRQHTWLDLIKTRQIRKRSVLLFYIWLATVAGYYGLIFKMVTFQGNKYLNFFVSGLAETVCYFLSMPVMNRFGCRRPIIFFFGVAAAMCLIVGIVTETDPELGTLTTTFALVGRCATAFTFAIVFVYTSELYPTVIRNLGMGSCLFFGRLGGVLVPQVIHFSKAYFGVDAIIVLGVVTGLAAVCNIFLPETHNNTLPEMIADVENVSDKPNVLAAASSNEGVGGEDADLYISNSRATEKDIANGMKSDTLPLNSISTQEYGHRGTV